MDEKRSILRHQLRALQRGSINGLSLILRLPRVFVLVRTRVYHTEIFVRPALGRNHRC